MSSTDDVRARGASDYFLLGGVYKNPPTPGSPGHNAYERGWMQFLKKNNGALVGTAGAKLGAPQLEPVTRPAHNAYAELKGRSRPR